MTRFSPERRLFGELHQRLLDMGAETIIAGSETGHRSAGRQFLLKATVEPPTITEVTHAPGTQAVRVAHFKLGDRDVEFRQGFPRDPIDLTLAPVDQFEQVTNGFDVPGATFPEVGLTALKYNIEHFRPYAD